MTKTLPTFTNIVADWHPLRAAHLGPCNICHRKNQRRMMMLDEIPPVFVLHFVEGLPDNDVRNYTFTFKGKRYSVTTIIQYNLHLKHFVTWIHTSDGSWLEFDDLKHPHCKIHEKLLVPAHEIHIVFWEEEEPVVCFPSSTFTESPPSKTETNLIVMDTDLPADELLPCTPDQSLVIPQNDTGIICALSESGIMDMTVTADTSIGSTTLLDTFEGLTHSDIITLTLMDVNAEPHPSNNSEQTEESQISDAKFQDSSPTPDSSSTVTATEITHDPDDELSTVSKSCESEDGSSSDPTFIPVSQRGRRKGKAAKSKPVSRQRGKKAPVSKVAPESSKVSSNEPAGAAAQCDNPTSIETEQQAFPVSSSNTSSPPTTQQGPTVLDQNARWSFLISKHPLQKSSAKKAHTPVTVAQVKPTPVHSTPHPVRTQQLGPKPQLRTEETGSLPPKAAEMYGAFGSENLNTPQSPPPPALLMDKIKLLQSMNQNAPRPITALSGTSPPKVLTDILPSKKHKSQSSKVPPGLSDTEALRYRLIKKLKAKKKKLAKLNELLGQHGGGSSLRPDSTIACSPSTITSSTYDGSTCDEFLSDLLSPATTASNLSPDSTGLLEMFTNRQEGADHVDCRAVASGGASHTNTGARGSMTGNVENFLDEFLPQAVAETPTDMETEALSFFDIFF